LWLVEFVPVPKCLPIKNATCGMRRKDKRFDTAGKKTAGQRCERQHTKLGGYPPKRETKKMPKMAAILGWVSSSLAAESRPAKSERERAIPRPE
jgi:hypothetical protein